MVRRWARWIGLGLLLVVLLAFGTWRLLREIPGLLANAEDTIRREAEALGFRVSFRDVRFHPLHLRLSLEDLNIRDGIADIPLAGSCRACRRCPAFSCERIPFRPERRTALSLRNSAHPGRRGGEMRFPRYSSSTAMSASVPWDRSSGGRQRFRRCESGPSGFSGRVSAWRSDAPQDGLPCRERRAEMCPSTRRRPTSFGRKILFGSASSTPRGLTRSSLCPGSGTGVSVRWT